MRLTNQWINGDCLKELKKLPDESVDLIITSPPYHNLRVYSNDPSDLSNCETYEEYYYLLGLVISECTRVLKPGAKFIMQYEDYNYTLGRDGKSGQESITGGDKQNISGLWLLSLDESILEEVFSSKSNARAGKPLLSQYESTRYNSRSQRRLCLCL